MSTCNGCGDELHIGKTCSCGHLAFRAPAKEGRRGTREEETLLTRKGFKWARDFYMKGNELMIVLFHGNYDLVEGDRYAATATKLPLIEYLNSLPDVGTGAGK